MLALLLQMERLKALLVVFENVFMVPIKLEPKRARWSEFWTPEPRTRWRQCASILIII